MNPWSRCFIKLSMFFESFEPTLLPYRDSGVGASSFLKERLMTHAQLVFVVKKVTDSWLGKSTMAMRQRSSRSLFPKK